MSVTRLRLRSFWYLLPFIWNSIRSHRQARRSDGCLAAEVRYYRRAFWTLTVWRDAAATRTFMLSGIHRQVMPKLRTWCDEASLAHWQQDDNRRPRWDEAEVRLGREGRTSVVDHPSAAHAAGLALGSHDDFGQ